MHLDYSHTDKPRSLYYLDHKASLKRAIFVRRLFLDCGFPQFQSNANRPLADRCLGYIVNKFEHVGGGLEGTRTSAVGLRGTPCG